LQMWCDLGTPSLDIRGGGGLGLIAESHGSYVSKLYGHKSDMDLCLEVETSNQRGLRKADRVSILKAFRKDVLKRKGSPLRAAGKVETRFGARIPVIRFLDAATR